MTNTNAQLQTSIKLTEQENNLLFSAISLSSEERDISAQLKEVKAKVIALFESRFDTENTGTIAKLGKSTIQVKKKAGKVVLTEELIKLSEQLATTRESIAAENADKIADCASKIVELEYEIIALQTSEEIQFMELDLKQRIAALDAPEPTYEVAIKV